MYRCRYCKIFEADTQEEVDDHVIYLQGIGDEEHTRDPDHHLWPDEEEEA